MKKEAFCSWEAFGINDVEKYELNQTICEV